MITDDQFPDSAVNPAWFTVQTVKSWDKAGTVEESKIPEPEYLVRMKMGFNLLKAVFRKDLGSVWQVEPQLQKNK